MPACAAAPALLLFASAILPANLGLTGGVPLTPVIRDTLVGSRAGYSRVDSAPRRYTLGPSVEWRLGGPASPWSLESGLLYKRFGLDTESHSGFFAVPTRQTRSTTTGNAWEITPALARVRFRIHGQDSVVATLGAGVALRVLTGVRESGTLTVSSFFDDPATRQVSTFTSQRPDRSPMAGAVLDAGLELRATPSLRLAPRFRLTRWDSERTTATGGELSPVRFARTQAELLLTFTFLRPESRQPRPARFPTQLEPGIVALPNGAGAFLDWRYSRRLSLEAGFLTTRFRTQTSIPNAPTEFISEAAGRQWLIPALIKARPWTRGRWSLALGAGPALRAATDFVWRTGAPGQLIDRDGLFLMADSSRLGVAATSGVEARTGPVRWRPELRWTWFPDPLYERFAGRAPRSHLQVVCGLSWAREN